MKSGTKLLVVALGLGLVASGAFVYIYYFKGESTDKVEADFRASWNTAVEEGLDAPDVTEFVKKVPKSTRPVLEKKLQEISQDMEKKFERIPMAIDAFSGYCVFRAKDFHAKLAKQSIYLRLVDDKANYKERIKGLEEGKTKLAVYTIDALLSTSVLCNAPPASIVMVIDESKGADALLAFKEVLPNAASLNQSDVQIVFTKESPSETLARVVRPPQVPTQALLPLDSPDEVMERIDNAAKAKHKDKVGYVLWEPFVSKMKNKYPGQLDVLVDSKSEKCFGKIVDVFVAEKKFLAERPQIVQAIVKAYLDTFDDYQRKKEMMQLVLDDAKQTGSPMERDEAQSVVEGIAWRSAQQNYDHFRIDGSATRPVEQMISELNKLLIDSNVYSAIKDPVQGDPKRLFDSGPLQALFRGGYQPKPAATVAADTSKLTDEQWKKLLPVNEVKLDDIPFSAGASSVPESKISFLVTPILQEAKTILEKNPSYYLEIRGAAQATDDESLRIARERAEWVSARMQELKVPAQRVKAVLSEDMTGAGKKRAVEFVLLEKPNQ